MAVLQKTRTGKATFLLFLAVWYLQSHINQQQTIKVPKEKINSNSDFSKILIWHSIGISNAQTGHSLSIRRSRLNHSTKYEKNPWKLQ